MYPDKPAIPLSAIIRGSMRGNPKMQKLLYEQYAGKMYHVCLSYTRNPEDAEDTLQEGFIKVFSHLDKFRGEGSFEGWIRTIITRTAISHIKASKRTEIVKPETLDGVKDNEPAILDKLAEKDIVGMITRLHPAYQTVFRMYVIEGYNHKEIAGMLGYSEGNSKSQLFRSRTKLQKMLKKSA
jgi:RNA polymerase sigma factor (sigma-70 family)